LGVVACLPGAGWAAGPVPESPSSTPLAAEVLDSMGISPTQATVTDGSLDGQFRTFKARGSYRIATTLWFRLPPLAA